MERPENRVRRGCRGRLFARHTAPYRRQRRKKTPVGLDSSLLDSLRAAAARSRSVLDIEAKSGRRYGQIPFRQATPRLISVGRLYPAWKLAPFSGHSSARVEEMADGSAIEWTESTWNPVTGCSKVSPGCAHCYAETFAERWRGVKSHPYEQGFDLRLWPERLQQPLKWRRPRVIFVNSMSDLFHEDIPVDFIEEVFAVMAEASWHRFQILTKRQERLEELGPNLTWPENVWMGVSVENRRFVHRADSLRNVPAAVRFISAEPLLGPLEGLDLSMIDWLIAGGESGAKARPMKPAWVRDLRDRCLEEDVAFFFKQWGGFRPKSGGRELDGRTWDQFPDPAVVLA